MAATAFVPAAGAPAVRSAAAASAAFDAVFARLAASSTESPASLAAAFFVLQERAAA